MCAVPSERPNCATSRPSSCSTTSASSPAQAFPTTRIAGKKQVSYRAASSPAFFSAIVSNQPQYAELITDRVRPTTVTYLLNGAVDHEDFAGNAGTIEAGDLQFMTAGRGIMHAEMPRQNADGSANVGLQLWVDLPANLKMCEPRYRDLRAKEIPRVDVDDKVHVKVISGQAAGVDSVQDLAYTPVWLLDVEVKPGGSFAQPLPKGWNAFAYQLEGSALFGSGDAKTKVDQYHNCVFEQEGDTVVVEVPADAAENARFVLIAGQVLDQKVVQYGPFVLNTPEEVRSALMDYQFHMNGFERAKDWQSEIGKTMAH